MGNAKNTEGKRVYNDTFALPADLQDLADDIYANDNVRVGTSAQRQAIPSAQLRPGVLFVEADTGLIFQWDGSGWSPSGGKGDVGWTNTPTGIFTIASGWALTTFRIRRTGTNIALYISGERDGSTISVGATGDITNTAVGTLAPEWRPSGEMPLSSGNAGRVATGYVGANGVVTMAAVGGSADITDGQTFSLGGMLFL